MIYKPPCGFGIHGVAREARQIRGLAVIALALGSLILSGCHTTAGVGQDVKAAGQAVTRGAQGVQSKM